MFNTTNFEWGLESPIAFVTQAFRSKCPENLRRRGTELNRNSQVSVNEKGGHLGFTRCLPVYMSTYKAVLHVSSDFT